MTARSRALIAVGVVIAVLVVAVPNAAAQISVTSVSPSSAAIGTMGLNVTITGSGFKTGATVTLYKFNDPSNADDIVVTKTTIKRSSQLIVTINVLDTAERGSYTIEVTSGGGSATALFSVMAARIDPCTLEEPVLTTGNTAWDPPGVPGYCDGTFAYPRGVVIGQKFAEIRAVALDEAHRIVAVGSRYDNCAGTGREWIILRYLPTGELDSGFGSGGVVTKAFERNAGYLKAVAIDSDGSIVVGGYLSGKNIGVVARYTAEGALDTRFAPDGVEPGVRSLSLERYMSSADAIAIQSDHRIVVAGGDGGVMAVFRLNADGSWDKTGFNANAVYKPQLPGRYVYADAPSNGNAVAIQKVGDQERIVVAGVTAVMRNGERDRDGAVWRFTSNGELDATFGTSGLVATDFFGQDDDFRRVAVDSANRIVVAGSAYEGPSYSDRIAAVLARYGLDGQLDSSFGGGTVVAPNTTWTHSPNAIVLDAGTGNIYVAGSASDRDAGGTTIVSGAAVWRFTSTGTPDSTFGSGGWVFDTIALKASSATWNALALQPEGKILVAGTFVWGSSFPALALFWR